MKIVYWKLAINVNQFLEHTNQKISEFVSTLKRRPSPSTSSLSSNSSCDRRAGVIQLTKFERYSGTQSPDAVNKLLRLTDSSHQVKTRAQQRANQSTNITHIPVSSSASPLISASATTTGLSSMTEPVQFRQTHGTKLKDANKLSSESSSLNFKANHSGSYPHRIRSQNQLNHQTTDSLKEVGGDSGRGSLNSTDTCVPDANDKTASTIADGFTSVRVRNRPPLPHSNTTTSAMIRNEDGHLQKTMRHWLQRSQSQTEVITNDRDESAGDYDEHEQVTAV